MAGTSSSADNKSLEDLEDEAIGYIKHAYNNELAGDYETATEFYQRTKIALEHILSLKKPEKSSVWMPLVTEPREKMIIKKLDNKLKSLQNHPSQSNLDVFPNNLEGTSSRTDTVKPNNNLLVMHTSIENVPNMATDDTTLLDAGTSVAKKSVQTLEPEFQMLTGKKHKTDEVLVNIPNGVTLYTISLKGEVINLGAKDLTIIKNKIKRDSNEAPATLKIGDDIYPLKRTTVEILESEWGSYILTENKEHNEEVTKFQGIVFAKNLSKEKKTEVKKLLAKCAKIHLKFDVKGNDDDSHAVALDKTAGQAAWAMVHTATMMKAALKTTSTKVKSNIQAADKDASVNPMIKDAVKSTQMLTASVLDTTQAAAKGLAATKKELFNSVIKPQLKATERTLSALAGTSSHGKSAPASGFFGIVSSAYAASSKISSAFLEASNIVASGVVEETVDVVQHSLGDEAGSVTKDAFGTVENVGKTAYTVQTFKEYTPANATKIKLHEAELFLRHTIEKATGENLTDMRSAISKIDQILKDAMTEDNESML